MELVAVDIGGTHARFAVAEVGGGGVSSIGPPVTLKTAEHASFHAAWEAFGAQLGRPLPSAAAVAFAGPVDGEVLRLTNSHWAIQRARLTEQLRVDRFTLVNDFAAVAHAVAQASPADFRPICGPAVTAMAPGVTTLVGPGTGLGVASLLRTADRTHIVATEGGHIDFAPLDPFEDDVLARLRSRHRRVSVERVVSGPGLRCLYEAVAGIEGRGDTGLDDTALWSSALDGSDEVAVAAFDRFCMILGSVAGDLALAHGASRVVIAGGLGARIADHLPRSGFAQRFVAKGRFEAMMAAMPVALITMPEPGLFGVAAAFATEHAL